MSGEPELEPPAVFDYASPADLFFPIVVGRKSGLDYRRFRSAALALTYAFEQLTPARLAAAVLEIDGDRYDAGQMRRLYEATGFPGS